MKRYIWFSIFTCIGVFLITFISFPEISIKQQLGLILGIQFIATGIDFLDHIKEED